MPQESDGESDERARHASDDEDKSEDEAPPSPPPKPALKSPLTIRESRLGLRLGAAENSPRPKDFSSKDSKENGRDAVDGREQLKLSAGVSRVKEREKEAEREKEREREREKVKAKDKSKEPATPQKSISSPNFEHRKLEMQNRKQEALAEQRAVRGPQLLR